MLSFSSLFPDFFLFLSFLAFLPIQHITLLKNTPASCGLLVLAGLNWSPIQTKLVYYLVSSWFSSLTR